METSIAVDIGGTKMLIAEVRRDASIVNMKRYPTAHLNKEEVLAKLIQGIYDYEKEMGWENGSRPHQVGIGINGIVDPIHGIWKKQDESDHDVAETEPVEKELGVKCYIDNDVKCTVIAENKFGAGVGCRDMLYINLGTGLAAGAIANGKLIRGTDGYAGEIGYMNFTAGEGERVELTASGMGINHRAHALLDEYPDSPLKEMADGVIRGEDVFALADKGDELAGRILDEMVKMTGLMISNLTCVLSPEAVFLGGGLITDDRMLNRIIEAVSPKAKQHLEKGVRQVTGMVNIDKNELRSKFTSQINFGSGKSPLFCLYCPLPVS